MRNDNENETMKQVNQTINGYSLNTHTYTHTTNYSSRTTGATVYFEILASTIAPASLRSFFILV
jgi:hypothetical protein